MNIGIVTSWFERGASYVSLQYAEMLKGNNLFIYARSGYDPNYHNEFNVTIDKNHNMIVKTAINCDQFENWIIENKITHILFNEQFWFEPILIAKKHKVICASYIDYYTEDSVELFEVFELLFCNTKRHFSVFEKFNNAVYIPWGTDVNLFKPIEKSNSDMTFFHSVGWSPFRKGTDFLIDAASQIEMPFKLIIHSQCDLIKSLPNQKSKIEKLINSNKLEIIIKSVEAPGLYHLGDVYVYPTRLEGIGLTIAEALSCGLPTIIPNNEPMTEFILNETCKKVEVLHFKKRDDNYYWPMCEVSIEDLKSAMEYYIFNKEKINELSKLTRNHALINLDWRKNASKIIESFKNLSSTTISDDLLRKIKYSDRNLIKFGNLYSFSPMIYKTLVKYYKKILK